MPSHHRPPGSGPVRTALRAQIWPRTLRPALASFFLPLVHSRLGRGTIDAAIHAHDLPAPLSDLVSGVVARTRLWPEERLDVARELAAHFADGLESGRLPGDLAMNFGNPTQAARMIARAKKRSRPLWYRALARAAQSLGILLLLLIITYAYLAARYFLPSPNIARNYAAEFNAPTLATPKEDRAWTLYLRAIRELGALPEFEASQAWPSAPEHEHFADAVAFNHAHAQALDTIRRAAALPRTGYLHAGQLDPDYAALKSELAAGAYTMDPGPAVENPFLMGVLMPELGEFRRFARILSADAHDAAAAHDRDRFLADVDALLGMGEQCLAEPFIIARLVGIAVDHLACEIALRYVPDDQLLRPQDRTRLAHRFAAIGGGFVRLNSPGERAMWDDMAQRFFSDNGHGDGHLCAGAIEQVYADFGVINPFTRPLGRAAAPVLAALPSRAEFTAQVDRCATAFARDDALPLWRASERTSDDEFDRLTPMLYGPMAIAKSLMGDNHYRSMFQSRDQFETVRAAVVVACALESHRAVHATYPTDLTALVPDLLPAVPLDPYDGKSLRYLLSSGRPVLYSIGQDLADDHATPPSDSSTGTPRPDRTPPTLGEHADWILYRANPTPQ